MLLRAFVDRVLAPVFVATLACTVCAGCTTAQKPAARDRSHAAGSGTELTTGAGDLRELRAAHAYRMTGSLHLERAYAARREVDREVNFRKAESALGRALGAYRRAMAASPGRYGSTIEVEIEEVAEYLRQLRRDRKSPS